VKTRSPDDIPIPEIAVKRGDQFLALAQGLVEGFVGLLHYMAFIASAELAFAKLAIHGHDLLGDDEPERAFHDNSRRHFESLSRRLILVHSITLVDAFISDLTTLLLISHPQTIAKDAATPFVLNFAMMDSNNDGAIDQDSSARPALRAS